MSNTEVQILRTMDATNLPADSGRAALLAELEGLAPEKPAEAAAPAPDAAPDEAKAAEPETSDDPAPEATEVAPAEAAKPDPELAKRLDAVQKAERRAKEALAKERADLEAERRRIEPDLEELKRYRALKARAKSDPSALLELAEYSPADAELVARAVYALSPKAAENPQTKEAAQRALREREQLSEFSALKTELAELKNQLADRDRKETEAKHNESYLAAASKHLSDDTPILRTMFERNPEIARQRVQMARDYFYQQTGEVPEPADVLRELEQVERNELIARGIDPDLAVKTKTAASAPVAGENKAASKTLSNQLTKTTQPRTAPTDPREARAELLKELEGL